MTRQSPHRSLGVVTLLAAVAILGSNYTQPRTLAQSPPATGGFVELATSTDVRPLPTAGEITTLLPSRGTFTFPAPYGTTGVRLTNAADCSGADCVSPIGPAMWTKISNSTGSTYLYVVLGLDHSNGGQGPSVFRFDKSTGETLNLGPLFAPGEDLRQSDTSGWYFSGTEPSTLYVPVDRELRRYNVLTHSASVVFDITAQFGDDKEVWEAHSSADDRMHSFTLRSATNFEPLGCAVYREDTRQFSYFGAQGAFEGCQVDRSGHWLLIKEDADNRIVDLTHGSSTVLLDANGAGGAADLGFGTMLAADDHNALPNAIRRWTFGPLTSGPVVYHDLAGQPSTFTSISFANARSASLDEQFACGSAVNRTNGPRANEIVCAKLDGSLSTLVVAPVMTDLDAAGGGDDDAAKAPNGTLDPTGEYYLWTSNAMGGRLDAFLVQVPSSLLVTAPGDSSAPTVAITAPAQSATVAGTVLLTATAADNLGVAGVQFKLDGVNLGTEVTSAPFGWNWNTETAADGVHVLTAVARDDAGNTSISVPVSVTVLNSPAGPVISGVAASGVKQTSTFITWSTNQLTDSQVEYGPTTSYGFVTTLDSSLRSSHMQLLTGLTAGTTYHYRVISHNAQNAVAMSGDFTFTTTAPLVLSNIGPSNLSGTSVTIGWTTNLAASTQIEYGLTTAYGDATEFDGAAVLLHAQSLAGLAPGTTYHYRVYSVTPEGALAVSADHTFATLSAPGGGGPAAPGGFVELATSTDTRALISASTLAALVPARGEFMMPAPYSTKAVRLTSDVDCGTHDCVFSMGGASWRHLNNSTGSDLLYAVIGLDLSNGGAGPSVFRYNKTTGETVNLGPLFNPSDDFALQTTAGWYFSATAPTMLYVNLDRQLRRVDILSHTSSVVFDITGTFGGDREITNVYSSNDDRVHSFTVRLATTLAAEGCGVYREDTQSFAFYPSLGGFQSCTVDKSGHYLLVKDGTDSRIINLALGTETTIANSQPAGARSDMGFGSMLMVDGTEASPNAIRRYGFGPLASGPVVYHDLAGQPESFTHISFANARSASFDQQYACGSAVNRTNGPRANEIVCVKLDGSLSTLVVAPVMTDLDASGGGDDANKQPFANLDPTGEYILWTSNAMGGRLDAFLVRVPSQLLVTPPADTTSPTVAITMPGQSATVSGLTTIGASAADFNGVAGVQFKLDGVNLGAEVTSSPFNLSWNTVLGSDGTHVLTAVARDDAGNTAVSAPVSVTVLNTATPPFVSNISIYGVTQSSALISWDTDQLADSQVEYGPTTGYGLMTPIASPLVSKHYQLLTGLTPGTTYHFRVTSRNAQLLAGSSSDSTFSTAVALAITNVVPSSVTSTTATISWATNLFATSQVEYGLTTNYGDATEMTSAFVTVHVIPLGASLMPGTTYHYRVYSVTGAGSLAVSGDHTFTTPSTPGSGPAPGGIVELATSTETRPFLTAGEIQAVLPTRGPFTLPAPYGTTAVRITNTDADCAGTDCVRKPGGANWRNMSNSASSNVMYIVLGLDRMAGGTGPTLFSYNKATGETANLGPLFDAGDDLSQSNASGWYFSATQPTSFYVNIDRQFRRYDVLTHASTVVFDVTAQFGADKEIAQVHSSNDDRVHSFTLRSTANGNNLGCGVYREDTNQYSFHPALGSTFKECQVDKSGRWLLVSEGATGDQNRIIDLVLGGSTTVANSQASGGDVDMGFGMMIARDTTAPVPNPLRAWTFGPLTAGPVVYQDSQTTPRSVKYLSFGNARSAPLGQQFACGSAVDAPGPRANEIACFRLDGSLSTLVVAPVMTNLDADGGGDDAGQQPNGNLDPTGEYFLWTSNAMGDRLEAFLVRVPSHLIVTPPADITPPAISITAPALNATVSGTTLLSATASDAVAVAGVQFQLDGVNLGAEVTTAPFAWNWNTATTTDGAHTLMAVARDAAGNTAWAVPVTVTVLNTPAAPVISGTSASSITNTSALIGWTTNQLADAQVQYGLTTAYGSATALDTSLSTSHLQLVSGLAASTTYHYRVVSTNAQGVTSMSADHTFSTVSAPVISGVGTSAIIDIAALVSWTTNIAASSQVEYGLTTDYGDATPFNSALVTSHGMTLTGLVTGTTYHYRVYSVSAAGVTSVSPDFTFTTATYPVITNVAPSRVSGVSATIGWTTDLASNSQVEYGLTTAYGNLTALDPALVTSHARPIAGLTPGTTYHYRVLSRSGAGLLTASADFTLTTPGPAGAPAPVVWTKLVNAAVNETLLSTTSTCNCGDSGASSVQFISSGDGYVEFTKTSAFDYVVGLANSDNDTNPSTMPFSIWVGPTYLEVRELGAWKWDHSLAVGDVIRISVGSGQVKYALNGEVFYTSATAPIYPLLVDASLLNTNAAVSDAVMLGDTLYPTPAVISNVGASGITGAAATVNWDTDMAATSQVEYGLTTAYGNFTSVAPAMLSHHTMLITGLTPATTYHYRVYSTNTAGAQSVSGDFTFTTAFAPTFANVGVTLLNSTLARVVWTTDQTATSQIEYGPTTSYGSTTTASPALVTAHQQMITGLTPGQTYHYRVVSVSSLGVLGMSGDFTFVTPALTGPAPVVWTNKVNSSATGSVLSNSSPCGCADSGASSMQYITSGDGYVEFKVTSLSQIYMVGLGNVDNNTNPNAIPFGLLIEGPYFEVRELGVYKWDRPLAINDVLRIAVVGGAVKYSQNGVEFYTSGTAPAYPLLADASLITTGATVTNATFLGDSVTTPPAVSSVAASGITFNSATITWLTDEMSTSRVEYGLSTAYGQTTEMDPAMVNSHSVGLTGLQAGQTYHYRVISVNAQGVMTISADFTFVAEPE